MERLLKEADKLSDKFNLMVDENGDLVYSYADIVDAIHIVQTEMGITGTTAQEAANTISGSLSSLKSAWSNLITGLSDENGNFQKLVDDFVVALVGEDGKGGALGNLMPKVDTALSGVMTLIDELVPKLIEALPGVIEKYLPMLVNSAISGISTLISAIGDNSESLASSLATAISTIISHAAENTPLLIGAVLDLILSLITEIGNNLGTIITEIITSIINILSEIASRADEFTEAVFAIVNGLVDLVTSPENNGQMISAGSELLMSLLEGMVLSIPQLVQGVGGIVGTIKGVFSKERWSDTGEGMADSIGGSFKTKWEEIKKSYSEMIDYINESDEKVAFDYGWEKVSGLFSGMRDWYNETYEEIWSSISEFFSGLWEKITGFFPSIWGWLTEVYNNTTQSVGQFLNGIWSSITEFFSGIWEKITGFFPSIWGWLTEVYNNTTENVGQFLNETWEKITKFLSDILLSITTFFTETIPQALNDFIESIKQFFKDVKEKVVEFFTVTIPEEWKEFKKKAQEKIDGIKDWFKDLPEKLKEVGKDIVDGLWQGIQNAWSWLTTEVGGLFGDLVAGIKEGLGIHSPSRVFAGIGKNMALGVEQGWGKEFSGIKRDIEKAMSFDDMVVNMGASVKKSDSAFFGSSSNSSSDGRSAQNVNVTVTIDENVNAMGLARELLPYIKIATQEAFV